ncbi:MAG: glutathione S-transferase family protein [Betaproteobacteria bacterium]|nr:glutathione S-transferase family protein [Betaproteobacteria bacterium]
MLKLWGRTNSVNVQKALWCLEELQVPYERVEAGGQFGVVNEPAYRALNPNGLVPTLEDDGFALWESNVIVRYLCAKHGAGSLWPEDLKARAEADKWMDWATTTVWPNLRPVFWGLVRTPEAERDVNAINAARKKTTEVLGILDAHLATRRYVAGPALTMGDIPLGCMVQRWMALPIRRPEQKNLGTWFERLCQRPGYQKYVNLPLS